MAAAGDGQRVRGDIFGDCGTGGDIGTVADLHGSHQGRIAAHEDATANGRGIFVHAVVIAGDGAGADIGFAADARVAQIGEVHGLGALSEHALFDFDKIANAGALEQARGVAQMCERSDLRFSRKITRRDHGVRFDEGAIFHDDIAEDAAGADGTARADARFTEQLHAWFDQRIRAHGHIRIDQYGFRHEHTHADGHQFGAFAPAKGQIHLGQIGARIATEDFVSIRGNESLHGASPCA